MKNVTFLTVFFLCLTFSGQAQWVTLYEGGFGTSNVLNDDWGTHFYYSSAPGSNNSTAIGGSYDDMNKLRLLYYLSDFGNGSAGMYKQITGMENYASLRVYLEMDLPDSIGTVHYAALTDGIFQDQLGNPLYDEFASDQLSVTIPYYNMEGHNTMYFFADLLRGDSVHVWFNYVRIEADTTQMLHIPVLSDSDFTVYSSGSALHIQPANEDASYEVHLYNTLGNVAFEEAFTGNQQILPGTAPGTYIAQITNENGEFIRKKIYIE